MKEYTYTNKAYLGIKEGIVPPAPQYLWINSEDNKLYKFGDNGWEIINNNINDGSRYIIRDFTLDNILSGDEIRVTSELADAIKKYRPLAIYEDGGGLLYNIEAVSAYFSHMTEMIFIINYDNRIIVRIGSHSSIEDGGYISVVPRWTSYNTIKVIKNANGLIANPGVDGEVSFMPGFFADKSVKDFTDNPQSKIVPINTQVTILRNPLTGNGYFRFNLPTVNTAVEYTINFSISKQCSWNIADNDGRLLSGYSYGQNLKNISEGVSYLMKITLYTFTNIKGETQTEYIAEVMQMTK